MPTQDLPNDVIEDPYLTTAEVAKIFRTSPSTVRYWRTIGYGPRGTKIGTRVLFRTSAVEEFRRECEAAESGAA